MRNSSIHRLLYVLTFILIVGVVAAYAQPVRVPADSVAFVQLEPGQYLSNFGERLTRTKPLRVHGKPGARAGIVLHRPTAVDPRGQTVNLSLHGFALRDWLFTGNYELAAVYNAGVEEGTYENIVVDATCGVAKAIWTTVDLWGIPVPHGPTLSGGHVVSMRLYGPNSIGFLSVGEVTDLLATQLSISGTGSARVQYHTVPSYTWLRWNADPATSEGRPKRLTIVDARMAEGAYADGIVSSIQRPGLPHASDCRIVEGIAGPAVQKTLALGTIGGGPTDPPPPPPALAGLWTVPPPPWGMDVPLDRSANRTVSGVSFPSSANPGDVIEVTGGPYVGSIGYMPFTAAGTVDRPIVIRGPPAGPKPRFNQKLYIANSSYIIITGIDAHKIEVGPGSHHIAIRECRIGDDPTRKGGGVAIAGTGAAPCSAIVTADCLIEECGNWLAATDQDVHGVTINGTTNNVWVIRNKITHVSGDAVQIWAGSLANQSNLHHVYVAGNEMWECKQTGGVAKQSRHVVFAQNHVHHMRPIGASPSAWGAGLGHQYGAGPIWFVENNIHDCSFGIQSGSTSGLGDGQDAYYVFNDFADIRHDPAYPYNPGTAWSNAALSLVGNPNKYAIGNTIRNADGGIYFPGGSRILVEGNVLADVLNYDVWLEDPTGNVSFNVLSNLAWPSAELRRANQPVAWPIGNVVADPATVGRTWAPSPEAQRIFDLYRAEFGVDLRAAKGAVPWRIGAQ